MIRTRRTQLAAAAVLGAVAVSSLSGCGTMQAGSAVIVGGQRTTDGQIQAQVNQYQSFAAAYDVNPNDNSTIAQAQIDQLLETAIWQRVADKQGIKVTAADLSQERSQLVSGARQFIQQSVPGFKGSDDEAISLALADDTQNPNAIPPSQIQQFVLSQALIETVVDTTAQRLGLDPSDQTSEQKLSDAIVPQLTAAATELKVKVSPRYGTFDVSTRGIDATAPSWIRVPAAAPSTPPAQAPAQ